MACTSSIVSEGWPIIKYSLIVVQPWEDLAGGFQQLLGADRFVDDLAHALGGRLGGQGKPAAGAQVF
jgi:hypothetical protein